MECKRPTPFGSRLECTLEATEHSRASSIPERQQMHEQICSKAELHAPDRVLELLLGASGSGLFLPSFDSHTTGGYWRYLAKQLKLSRSADVPSSLEVPETILIEGDMSDIRDNPTAGRSRRHKSPAAG